MITPITSTKNVQIVKISSNIILPFASHRSELNFGRAYPVPESLHVIPVESSVANFMGQE